MKVFKFYIGDNEELFHHMAVDRMDAILDICENFEVTEADIKDLQVVERLSAKRPQPR